MSFLLANTLLSCQSQQPTTPEERDEDVDGHYVVMMNPRTSQDTHIEVQGVWDEDKPATAQGPWDETRLPHEMVAK